MTSTWDWSEPQYEALVFDCDGTLADTMPAHYVAWVEALRRHDLTLDEDRFYAMGGWPTEVVCRTLITESGRDVCAATLTQQKEALFRQSLHTVVPIDAVVDVVRRNHGKRPMAVATGGLRDVCSEILAHCGILSLFDAVVTCEDVTRHKPHPDVFLEAARQLGVSPGRCLAFEDTDPGVQSAKGAGMTVVDVRTFHRPRRMT